MKYWDKFQKQLQEKHLEHSVQRPFIVAIDGLSGAGKTTLVEQLKNKMKNIVIIHIDDYIVERADRYNTGHEEWFEYYQLQWDAQALKERLFDPLHRNEKNLLLSFYNKDSDDITQKLIKVPLESIVIIEGVFLLRETWKDYYDFIVFLDCPKEKRYHRVLNRDSYIGNMEERLKKYQNRYWKAESHYLKMQKPLELAHLILKWGDD